MNPSHVRFRVLGFACSLSLITYLDRVCISRVKQEIVRDLGLSNRQMGFVFSAFLLGYMLFEVPGGMMGDRWGSRRVLSRIVLWWSSFTMLTGCVWAFHFEHLIPVDLLGLSFTLTIVFNSFLFMLLIRFLFGCGEAGAYPNLARIVGCWFPFGERAFAQGAIWMSARIGGAISPVIIGRLTMWFGWRQAFWILGAVGIAWVVAFRLWFRNRPEDDPTCNDAERELIRSGPHSFSSAEAGKGHGRIDWKVMLTSLNLWAVCLAAAGVSFAWYFFPTWQPQFFEDVYGIDYANSEWLTTMPWLGGAAACLIGGSLSDRLVKTIGRRWGRSLLGMIGFGGAGLLVLITPQCTEVWQAVALLTLAFAVNDIAVPVIWSVTTDIGGRDAGTVSGFINMCGAFGGTIGPIITPILNDELPDDWTPTMRWQLIFGVYAGSWFVAAAAWLAVDASKRIFPDKDESH